MKKLIYFFLLMLFLSICSCIPKEVLTTLGVQNLLAPDPISVTADGYGTSKIDALNNAWTESVRMATGMYLASETRVRNDEIFEEIATLSEGRVRDYKELYAKQENDLWHVCIEAQIDRNVIRQAKKNISKYESKDIDSITANLASMEDYMHNLNKAGKLLVSQYKNLDRFFEHSFRIELDRYTGSLTAYHFVTLDLDEYSSFSNKVNNIISTGANEKDYGLNGRYDYRMSFYRKNISKTKQCSQDEFRDVSYKFSCPWRGHIDSRRIRNPDFTIATDPDRIYAYNVGDKIEYILKGVLDSIFGKRNYIYCSLYFYNKDNKLLRVLETKKISFSPIYRNSKISPCLRASDTLLFIRQELPITSEELHAAKNIVGKIHITKAR